MGYTDLDNLEHDTKLAEALGNMMIAWAKAETSLLYTFSCVSGIHVNKAMMAYYRIPTFEARTKVILALIADWETNEYDPATVKAAVTKLSKLSSTRNGWVHSVWCKNKDTQETVIFDFRAAHGAEKRRRPVRSTDVNNHINAVRRRTEDLLKIIRLPNDLS